MIEIFNFELERANGDWGIFFVKFNCPFCNQEVRLYEQSWANEKCSCENINYYIDLTIKGHRE